MLALKLELYWKDRLIAVAVRSSFDDLEGWGIAQARPAARELVVDGRRLTRGEWTRFRTPEGLSCIARAVLVARVPAERPPVHLAAVVSALCTLALVCVHPAWSPPTSSAQHAASREASPRRVIATGVLGSQAPAPHRWAPSPTPHPPAAGVLGQGDEERGAQLVPPAPAGPPAAQRTGVGGPAADPRLAGVVVEPPEGSAPRLNFSGPQTPAITAAIMHVIEIGLRDVERCYDAALREHGPFAGTLWLHWTIERDGAAAHPFRRAGLVPPPSFIDCLAERMARWRFPRGPAGAVSASYAFDLAAYSYDRPL